MLFVAFITASTFFLLRNEQLRRSDLVLSAALAALGYLTRYNGLSAAVGVPLALIVANPSSRACGIGSRLLRFSLESFSR